MRCATDRPAQGAARRPGRSVADRPSRRAAARENISRVSRDRPTEKSRWRRRQRRRLRLNLRPINRPTARATWFCCCNVTSVRGPTDRPAAPRRATSGDRASDDRPCLTDRRSDRPTARPTRPAPLDACSAVTAARRPVGRPTDEPTTRGDAETELNFARPTRVHFLAKARVVSRDRRGTVLRRYILHVWGAKHCSRSLGVWSWVWCDAIHATHHAAASRRRTRHA